MKKFLTAISLVLGLGLATAQQVAPATPSKTQQVAKTTTKTASKDVKAAKTAPTPTNEAKMKKDGTPDKRYKENKKLKKDGTPDKRYKVNK